MKDKILVVGGYGQVGKVICSHLSEVKPGKVIAAGRNYQKAEEFSVSTSGKVIPLQLDIYNADNANKVLEEVFTVIMCLDQEDTDFVETCIERGIHYIDISPAYKTLSQIEQLDSKAREYGSTLVLGVGLAPGISNLLLKYGISYFDSIDSADIYLMLGIGEKHGRDGVQWLLNYINSEYVVIENNSKKLVKSFEDGKKIRLGTKNKLRTAYRFDLADQHIVPKTLGLKAASSRLCYDSALVTKVLAVLKRIGVFRLLEIDSVKKLSINVFNGLLSILQTLHLGSDTYVVKVDVKGEKEDKKLTCQVSVTGSNNTEVTGCVASVVAEKLLADKYPSGVYFIEQLFEMEDVMKELKKRIKINFDNV